MRTTSAAQPVKAGVTSAATATVVVVGTATCSGRVIVSAMTLLVAAVDPHRVVATEGGVGRDDERDREGAVGVRA